MSELTANEETYLDLVMALEDLQGQMSLLVAVCDDAGLRDRLVDRYEAELRGQGMTPVRSRLNAEEPSLTDALRGAIAAEPGLEAGAEGVITIVGADELGFVAKVGELSPQEKFFGYLQWTREGLLAFRLPLVLWVSGDLANKLVFRASDFWSWRKAVFRFERESEPRVNSRTIGDEPQSTWNRLEDEALSEIEVKALISDLHLDKTRIPYLSTLYDRLGEIYRERVEQGFSNDAPTETQEAFRAFDHAISLQASLGLTNFLSKTYCHRGILKYGVSQYKSSLLDHQNSLRYARESKENKDEANALGHLGRLHFRLGDYHLALSCYERQIEVSRKIKDLRGTASALCGLGLIYEAKSIHNDAICMFQESHEIAKALKDRKLEAASSMHLGNIFSKIKDYDSAIDFSRISLDLSREIGDRRGEAIALENLGNISRNMGRFEVAVRLYKKSITIERETGNFQGQGISLVNLGSLYQENGLAEEAHSLLTQALEILEPLGASLEAASALVILGSCFQAEGNKIKARSAYLLAKSLYQRMELHHEVTKCENLINACFAPPKLVRKKIKILDIEKTLPKRTTILGEDIEEEQKKLHSQIYKSMPSAAPVRLNLLTILLRFPAKLWRSFTRLIRRLLNRLP